MVNLQQSAIATGDGFSVVDVRCHAACAGASSREEQLGHVLVAVRSGVFRRRADHVEVLVDGTTAYLSSPGVEESFTHPIVGGDVCTAIHFAPSLLATLTGGDPYVSVPLLPLGPRDHAAIGRLTALARSGHDPNGTLAEQLLAFAANVLSRRWPSREGSGRPATVAVRQKLVDQARTALHDDPALGLVELGRRIGCSPHHLSRIFRDATGTSVSRYRTRLRVARALDRIDQGESNLAALAAELGFAGHLTRAVKVATGTTPTGWRAMRAR